MLKVAIEYSDAVDKITGDKKLSMRKYELSEDEWKIANDLHDVLKVRATALRLDACPAEPRVVACATPCSHLHTATSSC